MPDSLQPEALEPEDGDRGGANGDRDQKLAAPETDSDSAHRNAH